MARSKECAWKTKIAKNPYYSIVKDIYYCTLRMRAVNNEKIVSLRMISPFVAGSTPTCDFLHLHESWSTVSRISFSSSVSFCSVFWMRFPKSLFSSSSLIYFVARANAIFVNKLWTGFLYLFCFPQASDSSTHGTKTISFHGMVMFSNMQQRSSTWTIKFFSYLFKA